MKHLKNPYQNMGPVGYKWEGFEALYGDSDSHPIEKVFVFFRDFTATITERAILVTGEIKTLENMSDDEILGLLRAAGVIAKKLRMMGYEVKE